MSNEIALTNNASFAQLAEAMGMSADVSKKKSSNLARLKIDHKGLMGESEVNGKKKKVEVVPAGSYVLDIPNGSPVYGTNVKIRLFNQRFMYKRYIKGSGEEKSRYIKTIMAKDLKEDLRDNEGGFNCGKPTGYIEDFKSLPQEMRDLIKSIKRVRVLFGQVTFEDAIDAQGNPVEGIVSIPFIWEVDNKDAFKDLGAPIAQMAKQNRILPQHNIVLTTEEQPLPTGASYYLPVATLDLSTTLDLTDADSTLFGDFNAWIDNYNEYIVKEFNDKLGVKEQAQYDDVTAEFVDVEVSEVEEG